MSAPTRRPAGPLAGLLLAGLSSHPAAQAQTRNNTVAADVSVLVTAVRSEGVSTLNTLGNDVVTATSAGLKFQRRSGALTLDAQGRLTATHYDSGLYKDRITPTGTLAARLQPASTGFGVDVGASAQQVRPTQPNTVVSPVQLGGTYTASTAQISPFFDRDLSDTLNLQARLTRSTQQNSGNGDNTVAVPLDTRSRDDRFSLTRRATPLGWGLEAVDTETDTRSGTVPRYGERNLRGLLSYAVGGNLLLTGVLGHARTQYADSSWNDPIHGARLQWRPSPQDYLRADVEQRYWGQSHHLDFTHTSGRLTLGVNRAREVSTLGGYQMAQLAARAATLASTSTDLAAAAVSSSIQNGVTLKQSTGVSAQYAVSRRDRLLLSSGIIQTSPLTGQSGVGLLSTTTQDTRQRYVSVGFEHMLSRQLTWTNSIRWDRITTVLPGSADTQFRETAWKSALNSILTPSTSATIGVQRDIQHKTATADKSDTQLFVGLNHKL